MRLNENTPAARRIGPLYAELAGVPVLGATFAGLGDLEISINGAAWGAGAGTIVEIGDGYYYYQPPQIETATPNFVAVKIANVCDEFTIREDVELAPSGIPVDAADAADRRVGPLLALNIDGSGAAVLGATFAGAGELEISVNGSAWAAAAGSIVEMGDGYYYYIADPAEITARGWLCVKIAGACEESTLREDIQDGSGTLTTPQLTVLTTFSASFATARLTPWQGTLEDFPTGAELVVLVHYVERNEMYVARDADGVWRWPFDLEPDNVANLAADPVTLTLAPRGGWPPCNVEIQCAAALMAVEV